MVFSQHDQFIHPSRKVLLLLPAELFTSICDFVGYSKMFSHKTALILSKCLKIFLSFNDLGSDIINSPKFEFNNSYRVTRCHSIDKLINSTKKKAIIRIDPKLVISEEGSRVFNRVQTRLICRASLSASVLMQFT